MTVAIVQGPTSSALNPTVSYPAKISQGNLLLLAAGATAAGSGSQPASVTDSIGNVWKRAVGLSSVALIANVEIWWAVAIRTGPCTVNLANPNGLSALIWEVTTADSLDQAGSDLNAASATWDAGINFTGKQAVEFMVYVVAPAGGTVNNPASGSWTQTSVNGVAFGTSITTTPWSGPIGGNLQASLAWIACAATFRSQQENLLPRAKFRPLAV